MKIAEAILISDDPSAYDRSKINIARLKLYGRVLRGVPQSPINKELMKRVMKLHEAMNQ